VDIETTVGHGFAVDIVLPLEDGVVAPALTRRPAIGPAEAAAALK
jgi:hypothetical protein